MRQKAMLTGRFVAILLSLGSVAGAAILPASANAADPSPDSAAATAAATAAAVTAIDGAIGSVGANGSVEAYQGAIALALDQSGQSAAAILAAIDSVAGRAKLNGSARQALRLVRKSYKDGKPIGGTGGTGGAQGNNTGLGSGPTVGGGGSSNYSPPTP